MLDTLEHGGDALISIVQGSGDLAFLSSLVSGTYYSDVSVTLRQRCRIGLARMLVCEWRRDNISPEVSDRQGRGAPARSQKHASLLGEGSGMHTGFF